MIQVEKSNLNVKDTQSNLNNISRWWKPNTISDGHNLFKINRTELMLILIKSAPTVNMLFIILTRRAQGKSKAYSQRMNNVWREQ